MGAINRLSLCVHSTIDENATILKLKSDVRQLKIDVSELKSDVGQLKIDVSELKSDVAGLKLQMAKLGDEIHLNGIRIESVQHDMRLILDAIIPDRNRALKLDQLENTVEDHEHRIVAVEHTITGYYKDQNS